MIRYINKGVNIMVKDIDKNEAIKIINEQCVLLTKVRNETAKEILDKLNALMEQYHYKSTVWRCKMKNKQQILKAIECCSKMGTKREQACCSKCPYKKDDFCYTHLIKDMKWYVMNDVSSFVDYLKNNPDGSIQNFEDTETLFEYIEIGHLDEKELVFYMRR